MNDPKIPVAFTDTEIHFIQAALYGNVDWGWAPNLRRAEELHARLATASEALAAQRDAARLAARAIA